jgi:hypothetical protein
MAVALNSSFFATLPVMEQVPKSDAEIAWIIYDLQHDSGSSDTPARYSLKKVDEVYTEFEPALLSITTPHPGRVGDFIGLLQEKLDEHLETLRRTKSSRDYASNVNTKPSLLVS